MDFEQYIDGNGAIAISETDTLVNFIEANISQANTSPEADHLVYKFLDYSKSHTADIKELTWTLFGQRVHAVAARLQQVTKPGDRVAILVSQGLDYLISFFGSVLAGTIAVPLFDPNEPGHEDRLEAILGDCGPTTILTSTNSAPGVRTFIRALPGKMRPRIIAVDAVPDSVGEEWVAPEITLDTIAYLQYTSGSTRVPAGVQITHRNVVTNALQMFFSIGLDSRSTGVTWLPLFHDMGLLTVILPVLGGSSITLMSPQAFVQRPGRWIQALGECKDSSGVFAAAPNFAFELAARRGLPKKDETLDLSGVVGLINGSEPVTTHSMEVFNKAFAPYGLPSSAIKPSYGMAEATLFVSTPETGKDAEVIIVDREALAQGTIVKVEPNADGTLPETAVHQVGCGYVARNEYAVIVQPDMANDEDFLGTGTELDDGTVGEIWLHGENIGRGYWNRPEESQLTFNNKLRQTLPENSRTIRQTGTAPADADWLRTGDYGVYVDGQLYITGRVKDLVIVDGRNHYPQDLEHTAQEASSLVRPGFLAAFSVPANQLRETADNAYGGAITDDDSEQLVIVAERAPGAGKADPAPIAEAIRAALSARHGVMARDVVLTPAGAIPRTSSGKIAHRAARAAYLDGSLRGTNRQQAFPDDIK